MSSLCQRHRYEYYFRLMKTTDCLVKKKKPYHDDSIARMARHNYSNHLSVSKLSDVHVQLMKCDKITTFAIYR